jgi:hypothetical protein
LQLINNASKIRQLNLLQALRSEYKMMMSLPVNMRPYWNKQGVKHTRKRWWTVYKIMGLVIYHQRTPAAKLHHCHKFFANDSSV